MSKAIVLVVPGAEETNTLKLSPLVMPVLIVVITIEEGSGLEELCYVLLLELREADSRVDPRKVLGSTVGVLGLPVLEACVSLYRRIEIVAQLPVFREEHPGPRMSLAGMESWREVRDVEARSATVIIESVVADAVITILHEKVVELLVLLKELLVIGEVHLFTDASLAVIFRLTGEWVELVRRIRVDFDPR